MLIRLGPDKQPYVLVNGLSNSTQEEGEAAFKRFLDLGPLQIINVQIPWTAACNLANDINTFAGGKLFCGAHIDVFDAAQVQKSFEAWQDIVKKAPNSILMYEFYHYGKVAERPLESAAFAQRHELMTVLCSCMGFEDDYAPYAWDDLLKLKTIVAASSSKAAQESLGYANYGDLFCTLNETDEYTRKIFGSNYPRLQEIKKKYDPGMDLKNSCKGSVCEPRDKEYNNIKWAPNATRPSKIIVTPEETEDVVRAIQVSFQAVIEYNDLRMLSFLYHSGSNFGVVVDLGVKLHPQRADAYSISYVYLPSQLPEVVEAINAYRKVQNPRESVFFLMGLGPDKNPYVIINGLSNSSKEEGESAFNCFLDLKPVNNTAVQVPWAKVSNITDPLGIVPGGKIFVGAHIDKFDVEQVQKTYDVWKEVVKKAPFSVVMYEFLDYGKVASVPLENTAFAQRYDFQTVLCAIMGMEDDYIPNAGDDLLKLRSVVSGSSSQAARETLGYANYSDPFCTQNDDDKYARKLFGANYARLQEVKKKYDPDVVFDRWFTVRPAA
ncbi:hypothetical protein FRC00_007558 [Tulasnella sp. 408]|nr:hypothetical protein FRC00_007558 [Tulasnella sp. 408]